MAKLWNSKYRNSIPFLTSQSLTKVESFPFPNPNIIINPSTDSAAIVKKAVAVHKALASTSDLARQTPQGMPGGDSDVSNCSVH